MIRLQDLLPEVFGLAEKSDEDLLASKVAKQMGLVYKSFGRWADPKTNKIVAKTINGKLVRIDPADAEDADAPMSPKDKHASRVGMGAAVDSMTKSPKRTPVSKLRGKVQGKIITNVGNKLKDIAADPVLAKKTIQIFQKSLSHQLSPDDLAYADYAASKSGGLQGWFQAFKLVNDTMGKDGRFYAEYEVPGKHNSPYGNDPNNSYSNGTVDFDTFEDVWDNVAWHQDPRTGQLEWQLTMPERD